MISKTCNSWNNLQRPFQARPQVAPVDVRQPFKQANFIKRAAQIVIIVFAAAIAFREVGVANEIISLAFAITLFAIGQAFALAFGLGSKDIAGRELDNFLNGMRGPKDQERD